MFHRRDAKYADGFCVFATLVEIKAVEKILPVHEAQVISYLKLSDLRLGLLINFNVPVVKQGFRRFVNNLE